MILLSQRCFYKYLTPYQGLLRNFTVSSLRLQKIQSIDDFVLPELKSEEKSLYDTSKRIFLKANQIYNDQKKKNKYKTKTKNKLPTQTQRGDKGSGGGGGILSRDLGDKLLPIIDRSFFMDFKPTDNEEGNDIYNSIETYKPLDSVIGIKKFEKLVKTMNNAFTKGQLKQYYDHQQSLNPGIRWKSSSSLVKTKLIEGIILDVWNISKSKKLIVNDMLEDRQILLKPWQRYLLGLNQSLLFKNMLRLKVKGKFSKNKLQLIGSEADLNFIEPELNKLLQDYTMESIDLSLIVDKNIEINFELIQEIAKVYFHKTKKTSNIYEIYGKNIEGISLAKRLLIWSINSNPHIKDEIFTTKSLTSESSSLPFVPFLNEELFPWYNRPFNYFVPLKKDHRSSNDLIFDKFDKMSNYFIELDELEELNDARFSLNEDIPQDNSNNAEEEEFDDDIDKLLNTTTITTTTTTKMDFPDMTKILDNQEKAKQQQQQQQSHQDLEDLRKELGKFSNEDVDVSEFPNIAKLVEDFENADSTTTTNQSENLNLENLRKELNQFSVESSNEEESKKNDIKFDVIDKLKLIELETDEKVPLFTTDTNNIDEHLTPKQIDELYEQVSDLKFTSDLNGVNEDKIISSAYTLQFGTIVMKNKKTPSSNGLIPKPIINSGDFQFQFVNSAPFMNDLISSYPVIPQPGCRQQFNEQPYANSMAIRLIPSMYQMKKKNNNNNNNNKYEITDKYLKYPPVEIQAQLDRGQILHYTLQVLSLEAVKNVAIPLPKLPCDIQVSRLLLGSLLPMNNEEENLSVSVSVSPKVRLSNHQPDLINFLEESKLNFTGTEKINVKPSIELIINDDGGGGEGEGESIKIKYDYLHVSYKTDLKFIVNEREILMSFIEGGEFGGKNCEIAIGNGELSKNEFEKLLKDSILLIKQI